jgi:DNA replication protein DnaC
MSRQYKTPKYLSDRDLNFLLRFCEGYDGTCPTCGGDGKYAYDGVMYECPRDGSGRDAQLQLYKLYCSADLTKEHMSLEWEDYPHRDLALKADEYIDKFDDMRAFGMGLEIYGEHMGTGKTWMATYILRELLKMGHSGWFVEFNDIKAMWELYEEDELKYRTERMMRSDILVIDEIGRPSTEKATRYYEERLEWVIRHRTSRNLPTITTTNMEVAEMEHLFPRLKSLLNPKQVRIEISGADYRLSTNTLFLSNQALAESGERRLLV